MKNRYFGELWRNYRQGRGIALGVKVSSLVVLWSVMIFAIVLFANNLWLKWLLIAIATGFSIQLCRMKTLCADGILVLFPTENEAANFLAAQITYGAGRRDHVECAITGVGAIETAITTARLIHELKPKLLILAGIAGAYPHSGLVVGEVVLVSAETDADMGSFGSGEFRPIFSKRAKCCYAEDDFGLRLVTSNSVSGAGAPFVQTAGVEIENMEGAAFFRTCLAENIPFLEVRSVSNIVGQGQQEWDITLATANLSTELSALINNL